MKRSNRCTAGLQQVVTNFEKSKESLSGPVAIVAAGAEVARSDIANLFQFAAILNINLAVINILPLPVSNPSLDADGRQYRPECGLIGSLIFNTCLGH